VVPSTGVAVAIAVLTVVSVALVPAFHGFNPVKPHRFPTAITNVVVLVFENQEETGVLSQGPFFHYLAAHYAYASSDFAICHPSAPNSLALTAGATFSQCGSDTHEVYAAVNLADEIEAAGLSWGAYSGSMPTPCDTSDAYPYAVKHNPFLFYDDVVNDPARCAAHDRSLPDWYDAANRSAIPNYSFIVPNLLDDGHDTNVSYSDRWLRSFLSPLLNDSSLDRTAFLITYDEGVTSSGAGDSQTGPTNTSGGGQILLALVSPLSEGVGAIAGLTSQYTTLTTVEWLLGLASTGHNDRSATWPPITAAFS